MHKSMTDFDVKTKGEASQSCKVLTGMQTVPSGFSIKRQQNGSSLIEVLVTVVIVAIGLLGHAAILASTVKNNNSAYLRSQATFLANDVLERLRLNRAIAVTGNCNVAFGAAPPNTPNALSSCNTALRSDLGDWKTIVAREIPGGDANLNVANTGVVTINIRWDQNQDGDALDAGETFTTQSLI